MHSFYHSNKRRPSSSSIDGFVGPTARRSNRPKNPLVAPGTKGPDVPLRNRRGNLDDFRKPEGFRPQTYSQLSGGGASVPSRMKSPTAPRRPRIAQPNGTTPSPKKPRNTGKVIKRTVLVVCLLIIGFGSWFGGQLWWNGRKVLRGGSSSALAVNADTDPYSLKGEGDGRVNILLIGKGGDEHDGGQLTDSIMIASIDPINYGVTMLSIPRDLWVKPSGLWAMKINAVYNSAKEQALYKSPNAKDAAEQAGIDALEKTIEEYMGVNMHYYSMIDFIAFQDAVNAIGGVDITLTAPYSDATMRIGKKYLNLPAGTTHLDGATALGFARSRHGAARGDFDRGANQQIIAVAIKDKVLSLGTFSNPIRVSQLLGTFGNRVRTSFGMDDITRLYELSKQINSANIKHVDLAQTDSAVVKTGMVGNQSVVYPIAGVNDYTKVQAFVRSQLKDGFLIKENPTVIVLNGTTTVGMAAKKAEELKAYGYNVVQVADAPAKDFTQTQLVDQTNGVKKYTKRYLEQRLGVQSVQDLEGYDLTPYVADFVIIMGTQ